MTALAEAELIMNDHDGPGVIPGRYAGPAIPISTGPTPQQIAEDARKAAADRLAGQICAAAAVSAQATCALLELVAEFDATGAIRYWTDMKSVAHWLSWCCSMTPGVAREHVRVARALPKMPTVHAAFRDGRLSYSKVREISRVVDIIDETKLCQMATTATAAQLATTISAFRSCERRRIGQHSPTPRDLASPRRRHGRPPRPTHPRRRRHPRRRHPRRQRPIRHHPHQARPHRRTAADRRPTDPGVGAYTTTDALVDVGRVFLDTAPEDRSGEDRTLVVVHVSAELLNPATATGNVPAGTSTSPEANICHLDGQGPLEPATAQRLACDNPLLPAVIADGEPLTLGRTRRLVSRAQRRALMIRDRMCQHPGCHQTRHLKAHHIRSWAAGGTTDLNNLILLCQFHHTTVHEGGITITHTADELAIHHARRHPMPELAHRHPPRQPTPPPNKPRNASTQSTPSATPTPKPSNPRWAGEPFNIHDCVQALYRMKRPEPEDQQAA